MRTRLAIDRLTRQASVPKSANGSLVINDPLMSRRSKVLRVIPRLLPALLVTVVAACAQRAAVPEERPSGANLRTADALNLGFEQSGYMDATLPANWNVWSTGYHMSLDTQTRFSGTRSLRIESRLRPANAVATAALELPHHAAGKAVKLRGFIRTKDVTAGYAGLWIRAYAEDGSMLVEGNTKAQGVTGTSDWSPREQVIAVDSAAASVSLGLIHSGSGTAWFDSIAITIDGVPVQDVLIEARKGFPAKVATVRTLAAAIRSADPDAPTDDWQAIRDVVGSATIVALGEGTHGTREFFQMKDRIVRRLATDAQFTVFGIEASMPEARLINDYVLNGRGNAVTSLENLGFWTWNRQEVVEMIEWMRTYNRTGKGRLEFWGFDCQNPRMAMDSVRAFIQRRDPTRLVWLDSAYAIVRTASDFQQNDSVDERAIQEWRHAAESVLSYIASRRSRLLHAASDSMEVEWALQYARLVAQGAGARESSAARDSSMAINVHWILKHSPPDTKTVLWAHSLHVGRFEGTMGYHLNAHFGDAQRIVGFALGDGEYTALGPRGLSSYQAAPPPVGSVEEVFRATGIPQFVLDLRRAASGEGGAWLKRPHLFRAIGSMSIESGFYMQRVAEAFDAIIYFNRTSATTPVSRPVTSKCRTTGIEQLWSC